jgi:hypothetical protein
MECGTFVRATGIASLFVTGLLACSSSSGGEGGAEAGTASVTGSFATESFAPVDATAVLTTESGSPVVDIYVSNRGSLCGTLQRGGNPPGVAVLDMSLTGTGTALATGTYTINGDGADTLVGSAYYFANDAKCNMTLGEVSLNGTITITESSATSITGSFDAVFQQDLGGGSLGTNMDHITGTFTAPVCSVPQSAAGTATPACGS